MDPEEDLMHTFIIKLKIIKIGAGSTKKYTRRNKMIEEIRENQDQRGKCTGTTKQFKETNSDESPGFIEIREELKERNRMN